MSNWPESPAAFAAAQRQYERAKQAPTAFLRNVPDDVRDGIDLAGRITRPAAWNAQFGNWEDTPGLEQDEDLAVLKGLHSIAQERTKDMVATFAQVAADDDPSLNADGRLKIAAKVIEPKLNALANLAERELAKVGASIEREVAEIEKASRVADPLDIAVHGDIRRHWQGLDTAARVSRTSAGLARLDMQTLQALATGPAYLSGLSEEQQGRIRTELASRVAPDRVKRVEALHIGKARAIQALAALDKKANHWIDFKRARELIEREARRQAQE